MYLAEVYHKADIPFILLPIPPTYEVKNLILEPNTNISCLIDALRVEQIDTDVKIVETESGR